jgi:hypothetical protein
MICALPVCRLPYPRADASVVAARTRASFAAAILMAALFGPAHAGLPSAAQSRCRLVACPAGDLIATVTVRDALGTPVPFALVQVQLGGAAGLSGCSGAPLAGGATQTDLTGVAQFSFAARGAALNGAVVTANGVPLCAGTGVAGTDLTGNGLCDAFDMTVLRGLLGSGDRRGDLNGDGIVTPADTLIAAAHQGHGCTGSYTLPVSEPGGSFDVVVAFDSVAAPVQLAGPPGSAQDVIGGEFTLSVGPRLDGSTVRIELSGFDCFGTGWVGPTGATSTTSLRVVDDAPAIVGTWDNTGHFSFPAFRALLHSALADSLASIVVPDTIDVVPITGDTLLCTLSGTLQPAGNSYRVGWHFSAVAAVSPGPYHEVIEYIGDQQGRTVPVQEVACDHCKSLCILPVVLHDDNGQNAGISNADLTAQLDKAKAIWNKCCVVIQQGSASIDLNSTDLNTWGANETLGAYNKKLRDKLAEKDPVSGKPAVDDDHLKKCTVVAFLAHGAGPDGGGESLLGGDGVAINTTHLKTRCPGGPGKPDPDSRVLAHELGHTLGLPQTDRPGDKLMDDCGPGDSVGGELNEGDEGALSDQCAAVYKKATGTTDKPCFKSKNPKKGKKCTIKLSCK